MTKSTIHIPPAALEAGARADYEQWVYHCTHVDGSRVGDPAEYRTWEQLEANERSEAIDRARAAFVAMVTAWEGMHTHEWQRPWLGGMSGTDLILPLTEKQDDKA